MTAEYKKKQRQKKAAKKAEAANKSLADKGR